MNFKDKTCGVKMASLPNSFKCMKTIFILTFSLSIVKCSVSDSDLAHSRHLQISQNGERDDFGVDIALTSVDGDKAVDLSEHGNARRRQVRHGGRSHGEQDLQDGGRKQKNQWRKGDFVVTDALPDGERERRIRFRGTTAKETSVRSDGRGVLLRQVADKKNFVQVISDLKGEIIDCEYVQDKNTIKKFTKDFKKAISNRNLNPKIKSKDKYYKNKYKDQKNEYDTQRREKSNKYEDNDIARQESHNYTDLYSIGKWNGGGSKYGAGGGAGGRNRLGRHATSSRWERRDFDELDTNLRRIRMPARQMLAKRDYRDLWSSDLRNVTVFPLDEGSSLPVDIAAWLDCDTLKKKCDAVHARIAQTVQQVKEEDQQSFPRESRSIREVLMVPGTLWCGPGDQARRQELGALKKPDACCRAHDACPGVPPWARRFMHYNASPFTLNHCACDHSPSRLPRASSVLVPGTYWCGKGNGAGKYSQLGPFSQADRCCRMHDHGCPYWIQVGELKYGMVNWRPNTLMHCRCDERFRTCLKLANNDAANMVGRLFFNVIQTKCFVLKPVEACLERSWWGKCTVTGYSKKAYLRDNLPY